MASSPPVATAPHDELDAAVVQRAWRLLRQSCWPGTWEETRVDPQRERLVLMYARQLQRSEARSTDSSDWAPLIVEPSPPRPVFERRFHPSPAAAGVIDRKRAAAGDRDDD